MTWRPQPRRLFGRGAILLVALAAAFGTGKVAAGRATARTGPLVVVGSIFPLAAIAGAVAGSESRVVTLLTPGANPHTFEPTPSQVWATAHADLIVRVGLGFDDWVLRVVGSTGRRPPAVVASEGVDLLPLEEAHHTGGHGAAGTGTTWDPHLWLDPLIAAGVADRVAAALAAADPGGEPAYRHRARQFAAQMRALDAEVGALLAPYAETRFVGTHAGWAYFARRYRLRQVAVLERAPGRPAGPRYLLAVAERARRTGARAVFAEVQLSQGEARIIAEEAAIPVILLDPLGGHAADGRTTYADLLRWNARRIAATFGSAAGGRP